jgi:DNA modification methylase
MYADPWLTVYAGDCRDVLARLPAASADAVVTSPPYWMQRSYLAPDDPLKAREIGSEQQYAEWEATLVSIARELRRVLKPEGSMWLVLGDKYRANGGGYTYMAESGRPERAPGRFGKSWLYGYPAGTRRKSLLLAPYRLAIALCADGWVLRDEVIWHKTSAFPESVTPNEHAYFDLDAVLVPYTAATVKRVSQLGLDGQDGGRKQRWYEEGRRHQTIVRRLRTGGAKGTPEAPARPLSRVSHADWKPARAGANPGDVWSIAPASAHGRRYRHAAMYPPELVERPILATCPPGGVVLDPFAGTGTTGEVANRLMRRAVLIELDPTSLEAISDRTAKRPIVEVPA